MVAPTFFEIIREDTAHGITPRTWDGTKRHPAPTFFEILRRDTAHGITPENWDVRVEIKKYNPYHDKQGRFTFAPGGSDAEPAGAAEEYERFKAVLGSKNVPQSLDKFQDLKYNSDSDLWDAYKRIYSTATGYIEGGRNPKTGKPYQIITVNRVELKGIPNTITQIENAKGGLDRNYYGGDGMQVKQISNNDHGNSKQHPFGKNGEHAHDYIIDDRGRLVHGAARGLNDSERKENSDIL